MENLKILRTPDERFEKLPDYNFKPNYLDIKICDFAKARMHYIDEVPKDN